MEKVTLDPAIKFGAGRYRQEKNLLEECGKEISRFWKESIYHCRKQSVGCSERTDNSGI